MENEQKKKWLRDVETGDKYAVTDDTYLCFTIESGGQSLCRFGKDRTTLVTMGGMYVSCATDDPVKLKAFEDEVLALMKKYAD